MQIETSTGTVVELTIGSPVEFTATKDFQLPAVDGVTPSVQKGQAVQFDGQQLSYGGITPLALPRFVGVIKAGWVVLSDEYTGADTRPVSAGITVRPADGGNPLDRSQKEKTMISVAQAEEQEVGIVSSHASAVQANNNQKYRSVLAADQEGVEVRTLSSPKKKTEVTPESVGSDLRNASSIRVTPGKGLSREEMLERMTEEQRSSYLSQLGAHKASYVEEAPVVAQVKTAKSQETEGISSGLSVGGGVEIADVSGSSAPAKVTTTVVEGVRITNTNGAKSEQRPSDPRRVIAKSICPDFPDNYDFDAPLKKKLARIQADFDDRHDVIRAVAASEVDAEMKAQLIAEFPAAFGG